MNLIIKNLLIFISGASSVSILSILARKKKKKTNTNTDGIVWAIYNDMNPEQISEVYSEFNEHGMQQIEDKKTKYLIFEVKRM